MNDKFNRQYDYKANSNIVLPNDTKLIDKRPSNEATGEVQSLTGRLVGKMGDRVSASRNVKLPKQEEEEERRIKQELKRRKKDEPSRLKQDISDTRGLSVADIETRDLLYQPKSDLTATVYDLIIKFVKRKLGFQPNSIINGAADEVIGTMKDPNLTEDTRRSEVDKLLSTDQSLTDDEYNELSNLCKRINDWDTNQQMLPEDTQEGESAQVGVILDDADDDAASEDYLSEVRDSDDEFDLDDMFEKAQEEEDLSKRSMNIVPKIQTVEPIRKEGYQEYHIVPKKRPHRHHDYELRIADLPENERRAFEGLKALNVIQSKIYEKAMTSDQSMLICAPTGAGKTNIAILTMLREILKHKEKDGHGFDVRKFKIIYIAPIKALVQEIVENFTKRLGCSPYNLKVEELTGDHQLDQRQIEKAQIIVCTPEKWDIVTRKSLDRLYTKIVKLVIFDEIHLLHNDRGATLEALVARIKRHKKIEGEHIRIIGLSATLPNYKDVARFIAPDQSEDNSTFYFDSSYRPIPLRQQYIAMAESKKAFRMINDIVYEKVIERLVDNAQILVFVHSRPDTARTADFIRCKALEEQKLGLFLSSEAAAEKVSEVDRSVNSKLKELLQFGIGIHHAGLSKLERSCVEELFKGKYIRVLVSTATLAWGVNLPARTVIIKGTQVYRDGKWTDLDSLDVTQMLGRAGRPGFDREGEGIVITQQSQVNFYMSLMTEQLPVESKLIGRLAEYINAECVVGNIESLEDAVSWLSETYLNSRMLSVLHNQDSNQYLSLYGINFDARSNDPKLVTHRHNLIYTAACRLDDRGLIIFDRNSGAIRSTELGRIASHYNCSSRTIKLFFDSIHEHTSDIELLRTFSLADEFKDIFVRKGEETDLQALLNQVPYPIDDKRATPGANKVNALLQVYIFRMNLEGSDLICDMHYIKENAARLTRAIHEIVLMKGYALVAELSFDLCRKVDKRMTVCHSPLRQFSDDLDPDIINRLEKKNYHLGELRVLKADKLSELLRCERRHGEKIYRLLKYLPRLKIEAVVKPLSKNSLQVDVTILPDFSWKEAYHGYSLSLWLLVDDVNQESLLHYEMVIIRRPKHHQELDGIRTSFYVPYLTPAQPFYYLRIFPDKWFGCDHHLPVYMGALNLPDEVMIFTQLLDLEPRNVRELDNRLFEAVYEDTFKINEFNQIQTQAFDHLYRSDGDVILLASAGSGKTVCAELAIMNNINLRGSVSKSGYVAANSRAAKLVYDNWTKLFKHYNPILLTGNYDLDVIQVDKESTNIVIGDPNSWHILSLAKKKKYRKLFTKFQLFVVDDIHLIHSDESSTLEWVCSKLRIITKFDSGNPARMVVLGSPMTCVETLKSWLAVDSSREPTLLNYPPSIRPVKVELSIQKFHHYDYKMRLMTMMRPAYRLVTQAARTKPVLIFVADYYLAKEVCENIANYSQREDHKFVRTLDVPKCVQDTNLIEYLKQGVAYIYPGMSSGDQQVVKDLFDSNQIQVLIATVGMCWALQSRSYMTIVMDTQQHNGVEATEYKLTDIMQMVGLTGRPLADHNCKCIIMCHYSKAEYYERFLREPLPAESEVPSNLINHVNYEIATSNRSLIPLEKLQNIYKPYLAHTFFYKRITINPNYYGVIIPENSDLKSIFQGFFNELVGKIKQELEKTDFIIIEDSTITPLELSGISLEYYISFETLSNIRKWLTNMRSLEMIELISTNTEEFKNIPVRHGELQTLKALHRRYIGSKDSDQRSTTSSKVKLLILSQYQRTDGREDQLEGELNADRQFVISLCHRILNAIMEIAYLEKDSFSLAKTAMQLSKKMCPFHRSSSPNINMDASITRENDSIIVKVVVDRENDPFSMHEFLTSGDYDLPIDMYRDEGWAFLVHGIPRHDDGQEKFVFFKRIKAPPTKGQNDYTLTVPLADDTYILDLYFMSDFYSTREDRKVPYINNLPTSG